DGENPKDSLPPSRLQVSNAGVKVFDQQELMLKPGKRYVWVTNDDDNEDKTFWYRRKERDREQVLQHYWIILDFVRGHSPILPSRLEVDIDQTFSEELKAVVSARFIDGWKHVIGQIADRVVPLKARRKYILGCLIDSVHASKAYHTSATAPSKFCDVE